MKSKTDRPRSYPGRGILAVAAVGVAVSIAPLDTAVNVGFPDITIAFRIDVPSIQWVIIAYTLTYSSLLLGFGRLADLFGHRWLIIAGLWWSAVAFLGCASAPSFEWFLVARSAQGIGTAMVLCAGPALATLSNPESDRARVLSIFLFAYSAAFAAGPILGGYLIERWGWPAVFWFRIPIALIAIALVVTWVPVRTVATQEERFDLPGAIGLALAMTTGLLALTRGAHFGWLSAPTVGLLGIGIVAGTWFANRQGKVEHPVIDISLFRQRRFVAANSAHVMVNAASFLVLLLVPYYLAQAMRVHGSVAGMILAISPIGLMVASAVAGRLIPRLGAWALGLGAIGIVAAGLAGIAALPSSPPLGLLGAVLFIHGFGHGLFQVAILDLVMATIPPAHHGVAGSLNMMTRTIGVVVGASGGVLIFGRLGGSTQSPASQAFLDAFNGTFWAACAVVVAAGVLVVLATPQSRQ